MFTAACPFLGGKRFFCLGLFLPMNIFINGNKEDVAPCTLAELIDWKKLNAGALVVELNQQIIKQEFWPATELQEGDRLEMLSFVGGG